jgi:drug/metabolite transporter (DMT)-like permease
MFRSKGLVNPLLFASVVVAWGLTWYAIKLQLGPTPPETSIFWRFFLAAAAMWAGLIATGRLKRAPLRSHLWLLSLGIVLFSGNFLCFYNAERFTPSGVVAVVFAVAPAFNVVNLWLLRGVRPSANAIVGAILGALGVACLFADQLAAATAASGAPLGVALAAAGAYCFSLGNLISQPATRAAGDLPNAIARAMTWGTAILAAAVAARGLSFKPTLTPAYLGGLVYLAAIGSVFGFLAYLALVARIGPARAAYTTVLSPVIALAMSSLLEGYLWSRWALVGAPLILLGQVVMFGPPLERALLRRRRDGDGAATLSERTEATRRRAPSSSRK